MKTLLAALGCAALLTGCAVSPYYPGYDYYGQPYAYGYDDGPYYYAPGYYYGPSFGFSYYGGHDWHGDHGHWHGRDGGHHWHSSSAVVRHGHGNTAPAVAHRATRPHVATTRPHGAPRGMARATVNPEQRHAS